MAESKPNIEWERLQLDKPRLELEKSNQRNTLIQIGLPLLVTLAALALGTYSERHRSLLDQQRAHLEYKQGSQ